MENLTQVEKLAFDNLEKIFADKELSNIDLLSLIYQENTANDKQKIHFLFSKYVNAISQKTKTVK
jgi:hypothetical protein